MSRDGRWLPVQIRRRFYNQSRDRSSLDHSLAGFIFPLFTLFIFKALYYGGNSVLASVTDFGVSAVAAVEVWRETARYESICCRLRYILLTLC